METQLTPSEKWQIIFKFFDGESVEEIAGRSDNTKRQLIYMVWAVLGYDTAVETFTLPPVFNVCSRTETRPKNYAAINAFSIVESKRIFDDRLANLVSTKHLMTEVYKSIGKKLPEHAHKKWFCDKLEKIVGPPIEHNPRGKFYSREQLETAKLRHAEVL